MWQRFITIIVSTFIISITLGLANVESASAAPMNVINGRDVQNEQPWMVGLLLAEVDDLYNAQFCGGTLIAEEWVLTAAHCTFDLDLSPFAPADLDVVVGSRSLENGSGTRVAIDRIIRHRDFDFPTYHNDIALLHLTEAVDLPTLALPTGETALVDETITAKVMGWGLTEAGMGATTLQQAELPIVAQETCAAFYANQHYTVADSMLCAGYQAGGVDACSGDSGGPLVVWDAETLTWVQAGVVSAGAGCAEPGYFGLYTRVSSYTTWIAEIIG